MVDKRLDDDVVDLRLQGHVAHVTLNRPHVLNAMNLAMHKRLAEIWDHLAATAAVRAVVISGAGDRAFSVGMDLKERVKTQTQSQRTSIGSKGQAGWPRLTERFDFPKPLIAAVKGFALGGGLELALACDMIICADDSTFGFPEATLGLIPGAGGVFRLMRQAPSKLALSYLLSARRFGAYKAQEMGLVTEIVPPTHVEACAIGWAEDISAASPLAVASIRQMAAVSESLSLEDAFAHDYPIERRRITSKDPIEGPVAFLEKRAPCWSEN